MKPPKCQHCKVFGHLEFTCKRRPISVDEMDRKSEKEEAAENNNDDGHEKSNEEGYVQVNNVRKKNFGNQAQGKQRMNNGLFGMRNKMVQTRVEFRPKPKQTVEENVIESTMDSDEGQIQNMCEEIMQEGKKSTT